MPEKNLQVKAKVQVTVEVALSQAWESSCPMDQVHSQASEQAINILTRKLSTDDGNGNRFIISGMPKVIVTTSERV